MLFNPLDMTNTSRGIDLTKKGVDRLVTDPTSSFGVLAVLAVNSSGVVLPRFGVLAGCAVGIGAGVADRGRGGNRGRPTPGAW
jgi:hypothetical protein